MRFALLILLALAPATAHAQYTPQRGIPAPSFGVAEQPGPTTYWVDEAKGSDFNPGKDAAKPRRTVPRLLLAGDVVNVTGAQTTVYSSPQTIECKGTITQPVFITGTGSFTAGNELSGSYCIIDVLDAGGWVLTGTRSGAASNSLVIRHSHGKGHFAIANNFGAARVTNSVLWDVHGCGEYDGTQTEADGDKHGVVVGKRTGPNWVINSEFSKCSGDAVQVNGSQGGQNDTGPTYIGGLIADGNRQSGIGVKQSWGTVISGARISNMRHDKDYTNPGAGIVSQYWARQMFVIDSVVQDSDNCLIVAGYDNEALTPESSSAITVVGLTCGRIRSSGTKFDATNPRSPGWAIQLIGASKRSLTDVIIDDSDGGVSVVYPPAPVIVNLTQTRVGPSTPPPPSKPACSSLTGLAWLIAIINGACI